jgi:hypothetical protein
VRAKKELSAVPAVDPIAEIDEVRALAANMQRQAQELAAAETPLSERVRAALARANASIANAEAVLARPAQPRRWDEIVADVYASARIRWVPAAHASEEAKPSRSKRPATLVPRLASYWAPEGLSEEQSAKLWTELVGKMNVDYLVGRINAGEAAVRRRQERAVVEAKKKTEGVIRSTFKRLVVEDVLEFRGGAVLAGPVATADLLAHVVAHLRAGTFGGRLLVNYVPGHMADKAARITFTIPAGFRDAGFDSVTIETLEKYIRQAIKAPAVWQERLKKTEEEVEALEEIGEDKPEPVVPPAPAAEVEETAPAGKILRVSKREALDDLDAELEADDGDGLDLF